jgi:hypothetical protein
MNIPNYPRYNAFSGPRSGLYGLQNDVNTKLAYRGAAPIEIIGPDGRINWGSGSNASPFGRNIIASRPVAQPLSQSPREIVVNVERFENTTPVRRRRYVDTANGEERLRPDEVFDENGNIRPGFMWRDTDSGMRGIENWFRDTDPVEKRSQKYWRTVINTGSHGRQILSDNPPTISGMRN